MLRAICSKRNFATLFMGLLVACSGGFKSALNTSAVLAFSQPTCANESFCHNMVTIASLTDHNTSAYSQYNQSNFPVNFGTTSYVSSTQTITIDPTQMDISMNPATPGHVSGTNVHDLIPSRPDLRWFAHVISWWNGFAANDGVLNGEGQWIENGTVVNSTQYVQALITDLMNRGFNGVFILWSGQASRADAVAQKVKAYIATLPAGSFSYAILIDQGLISNVTADKQQATLDDAVNYIQTTYWSDPNYEKEPYNLPTTGTPLLPMYGIRSTMGSAAPLAAVKAKYGGYWMDVSASYIGESWADGAYDWHDAFTNGVNASDPYNLNTVGHFLSTVAPYTSKHSMGAMTAGSNGTLTEGWDFGQYLPRDSGKGMIQRASFISAHIPSNVTRMQWVTWNDYMEGTSVEGGVENNVAVTLTVQGSIAKWTYTSGTGDESTIDHYEIYVSPDGVNAMDLGSLPTGQYSFDLGSNGFISGFTYQVLVVAVGKPCLRNHISNLANFQLP